MTTRRLTQQSRRQLEVADLVRIRPVSEKFGSGYGLEMFRGDRLKFSGFACSSQGPMEYPTPTAALRALRRIRPDMLDVDVPIAAQPRAPEYSEPEV